MKKSSFVKLARGVCFSLLSFLEGHPVLKKIQITYSERKKSGGNKVRYFLMIYSEYMLKVLKEAMKGNIVKLAGDRESYLYFREMDKKEFLEHSKRYNKFYEQSALNSDFHGLKLMLSFRSRAHDKQVNIPCFLESKELHNELKKSEYKYISDFSNISQLLDNENSR
jgi:hypothetical protein